MNEQKSTKKSGIYRIINKINGKYYVGSSDNILGVSGRFQEHINALNNKRHDNNYLQKAWNKYGSMNFDFVIVEEVVKENLLTVEQSYLDQAKHDGKDKSYNLSYKSSGGGFLGHKHSRKTKKLMSEKLKGRIVSDETRKRLSRSLVGRVGGFVGKTHDEKWKMKHRKTMQNYWRKKKGLPLL